VFLAADGGERQRAQVIAVLQADVACHRHAAR
jgi:hypothetical protein